MPKRILLTGGPGSGKTTQINHLEDNRKHAEHTYELIPEVSRQLQKIIDPSTQKPLYNPSQDPNAFTNAILEHRISDYNKAEDSKIYLYDRGLIDSLAYCAAYNCSNQERLFQLCQTHPYDLVIFFPFWPEIYQQDDGRCETFEQAQNISNHIEQALKDLNIKYTTIPHDTPENRDRFILEQIQTIAQPQRLL